VTLKLIPKPEGFELRDKRSDKAADASLWEVGDALFNANETIAKMKADSVLICWRETHPPGQITHLLMGTLGKLMGWRA
jgi:hypothetical protein